MEAEAQPNAQIKKSFWKRSGGITIIVLVSSVLLIVVLFGSMVFVYYLRLIHGEPVIISEQPYQGVEERVTEEERALSDLAAELAGGVDLLGDEDDEGSGLENEQTGEFE